MTPGSRKSSNREESPMGIYITYDNNKCVHHNIGHCGLRLYYDSMTYYINKSNT